MQSILVNGPDGSAEVGSVLGGVEVEVTDDGEVVGFSGVALPLDPGLLTDVQAVRVTIAATNNTACT